MLPVYDVGSNVPEFGRARRDELEVKVELGRRGTE